MLGALGRYWQRPQEDNREYLEKLFQATLEVPIPAPGEVKTLITQQLKRHKFPNITINAETIEQLLEPNPRKIKNFLNSLCATWSLYTQDQADDYIDDQCFILFHYLRLYHRSVWRLLEHQRWALQLLHRVLTGVNAPLHKVPDGIANTEQVVMKEMLSRAFSHVLKNVEYGDHDPLKHRGVPLEQAVQWFIERQDRKRSDEYFIERFKRTIGKDEHLPDNMVFLNPPTPKVDNHAE